jgi:LysM repeat protein
VLPDDWRRFVAPAAFLLAATIAVVLIRSGLEAGSSHHGTTAAGPPAPGRHVVATTTATTKASPAKRFWVVRAGDTFAVISSKSGVPVATLVRLNPNAHSTSLFIGEKIRLR